MSLQVLKRHLSLLVFHLKLLHLLDSLLFCLHFHEKEKPNNFFFASYPCTSPRQQLIYCPLNKSSQPMKKLHTWGRHRLIIGLASVLIQLTGPSRPSSKTRSTWPHLGLKKIWNLKSKVRVPCKDPQGPVYWNSALAYLLYCPYSIPPCVQYMHKYSAYDLNYRAGLKWRSSTKNISI